MFIVVYSVNRYSYSVLYFRPIVDHFNHFCWFYSCTSQWNGEWDLTINKKGKRVFKCSSPFNQQKGRLVCWKIPDQHGGFYNFGGSNLQNGLSPKKWTNTSQKNLGDSWSSIIYWLVVWNMAGLFSPYILGMSSSQLTFTPSFFQRGWAQPPTR